MAVIFEEQTLEGFENGEFVYLLTSPFELIIGEIYCVVFDGTEMEVECRADDIFNTGYPMLSDVVIDEAGQLVSGTVAIILFPPDEAGNEYGALVIESADTATTTHTLAIYHGAETAGVSIVLYDRTGAAVTYEGVETITTDTPDAEQGATFTYGVAVENAEYELSMAEGDQKVTLEKGQLLKEFTMKKPETLLPEYIKKGIEVAGVVGEFAGDVAEKTVALDMTDGDQVIEADEDTVLTKVTVTKPDTLVPENIKKDVNIGGVVGTLAGGGYGDYTITVIDYDGVVILEEKFSKGDVFILPEPPIHEQLVFDCWSATTDIVDGKITIGDSDIMVGAMYITASGATEVDIDVNKVSGLTFSFCSTSVLSGYTSIDWGDGTVDTKVSHTYSDYGKYTIKIYGMIAINTSSKTNTFADASYANMVEHIRLGQSVTTIEAYAFYNHKSLQSISVSSNVNDTSTYVFYDCFALKSIVFPQNVSFVYNYTFYNCYSLETVVIHPSVVGGIGAGAFYYCYALKRIVLPYGLENVSEKAFYYCYTLKSVIILSGITSIGTSTLRNCYALEKIVMPSSVALINGYAFANCFCIMEFDFSGFTSVPTLSDTTAFSGINKNAKIKVPAALYDEWIAATNWSTYANYIVAV